MNRVLFSTFLSLIQVFSINQMFPQSSSSVSPFNLAVIQMYVEPGSLEKNLDHAEELIREAAAGNADVVLLPEVMDLGWTHPSAKELAGDIPEGETCQRLCRAALENNVFVCAGIVERDENAIYNAAVIIDNKGNVILKHRKLNELDIAHDLYSQGDRLGTCLTPWGRFGLMICADANAKGLVISRSLCYMNADVILSPSSWAVPPAHNNTADPYGDTWRNAYFPVAREFSVWIASASNVGPVTEGAWKNWKCIGCSLIVGPEGKEMVMGPYGENAETILFYTIDPRNRPARGTGWSK